MATAADDLPPFSIRAVTEAASTGMPAEMVATSLDIKYSKLKKVYREKFDAAFAVGVAQGVQSVFSGLRSAAEQGDTKAAQMFLDHVGVTPRQVKPGGNSGEGVDPDAIKTRRLLVEVSVPSDDD